jgi:hypothetical protein
MLTHSRNRPRRMTLGMAVFALLGAGFLAGCQELNDNPAGVSKVVVSFGGPQGSSLIDGLIATPSNSEPILSIVVGAIVITHRDTPYTAAAEVDEAARELLKDDAIQSAAYLTVEDLPFSGNSISFLIPPGAAQNWQLVGVGSRRNIDVLNDFEDHEDAPIWYGFTPYFAGGPGADPANVIAPGDTRTLTLEPGCNLDQPPIPPCP